MRSYLPSVALVLLLTGGIMPIAKAENLEHTQQLLTTNDCSQCVSATSCEGRCCPGRDDFCTPPQAQCYCDEACRSFNDCCDDVSFACGF